MSRIVALGFVGLGALAVGGLWYGAFVRSFYPDTTVEGAYQRIAKNIGDGALEDAFAYLETDAQWASFTIQGMRAKACARVRESYPPADAELLLKEYGAECAVADRGDGAAEFAVLAKRRGWAARLKRDLSGIARVDVDGSRATVVTARGTHYPFRRRDNGIWGLTIFTAELLAESEKATRDLSVVEASAADYDRAR